MPSATYEQLLAELVPQVIETEEQYREIGARLGDLVGKGRARTNSETKLLRLLAVLIEDYDSRHAMPPSDASPGERLRFLMEHSGRRSSDLLPIFGQRSHVSEALKGKRKVSVQQAHKLAKLFSVKASVFL